MKKLLTLVAVAGMFTFVACGPSAEEKAAVEKAKQDSIAAADAEAKAAAEAEAAAAEKAAAEATAKADSIAKVEEEALKGKKGRTN